MPATQAKSRWVNGNLTFYDVAGNVIGQIGTTGHQIVCHKRSRQLIASVNAGVELLPALGAGFGYRMVDMAEIAIGGAGAAVTTVDILGTQATASVKLMAGAQASLTRSTLIVAGLSGGAILADGASYMICDANTNITANITGASITTATNIDFFLTFVIEAA